MPFEKTTEFRTRENIAKKLIRSYLKCMCVEDYKIETHLGRKTHKNGEIEYIIQYRIHITFLYDLDEIMNLVHSIHCFCRRNKFFQFEKELDVSLKEEL